MQPAGKDFTCPHQRRLHSILDIQCLGFENASMAHVVVENLTKIFKGLKGQNIPAVRNLSLLVEEGEFLVLVGPSGCGKTTTLRMIAGLEEITNGTISIDGKVMNDVAPKNRDIAMVFQNHALYPHMTAYENMAFGLEVRKTARTEIERRVREAAEMLGLNDCLNRKPETLSGGQRQRVALGRAIVRKPKVFLFDEPLSNLDAPMRAQMRNELRRLHSQLGSTMIFVTHDQSEAMALGDRIAVMKAGTLQQVDEPIKVYNHPANLFVAKFIGSPTMNLLQGSIVQKGGKIYFQADHGETNEGTEPVFVGINEEEARKLENHIGKELILGLRSEHIHLQDQSLPARPDWAVKATITVIEPMGAETYIYATAGRHSFTGRIPSGQHLSAQSSISLIFDMSHAHFFDPATELAIR
jgi:multiple sugar transport system ATP-binding protein